MRHYEFEKAPHEGVKGYEFYTGITSYIEKQGADRAAQDFVDLMPWGTPEQVLEKFDHIKKMIGMNAVMPGFSYGGMPFEDAERSLRLFAEECLPEILNWECAPLAVPGAKADHR